MLSTLGSFLLTASAAIVAPTPSALAGSPARAVSQGTPEPSIFGEPIFVYGKQITDDQIKRLLCFGTGRNQVSYAPVDMLKFNIMVQQELERRKAAGEDVSRFVVTDEQNMKKLQTGKEEFLLRYPTLDFPTEVGRSFLSLDLFVEHQKNMLLFDRLFIPDNPDEWSELTLGVVTEFGGELFVTDARESYANRKARAEAEHLDEIPPDDPIFTDTLRQLVLQALNNWAVIHTDFDEIVGDMAPGGPDSPSDPAAQEKARYDRARAVLATVDGVPIMIDEVWQRIAPFCTPDLVEDAKRFLVLNALLERDLAEKGTLMSPAEFRAWWPTTARVNPQTGERPKMSYQEYLNNHEMLSSQVLGFPSLYHFAQFTRISESYRKAIAEELAKDDNLIPLMPTINQVAGASKLNVEVILASAYDFANVHWKDNGWELAKKKAFDVKKQLDEGAEWTPLLELHSDFWDPPMPETGTKPQFGFMFKGKFGEQTRNQLLGFMFESEFRIYLWGPSITDHIFFDQKIGTIEGPFRGPKGYYISRVTGKTPFSRPLDIKEKVHREILEHHYLKNKLNARAQELLAKGVAEGQVKGIALGGGFKDV